MSEVRHPLARLLSQLRDHRGTFILASVCSILNKIWDLAPPILIGLAVDVVAPETVSVRKYEGTQTMSFTVLEASDVLSSVGIGHGAKDGGRGIFIQSQVLTRLIEARQHFVQRFPLFGFAKRLYLSTFGPRIVLFSAFDDWLDLRLDAFGLRSFFFLGAAADEACNGNQA